MTTEPINKPALEDKPTEPGLYLVSTTAAVQPSKVARWVGDHWRTVGDRIDDDNRIPDGRIELWEGPLVPATEADSLRREVERITTANAQLVKDLKIAEAALPLFDETAITEEWLRSVGFGFCGDIKIPGDDLTLHVPIGDGNSDWTYFSTDGGDEYCNGHTFTIQTPKTRGQLRLLAKALGIPLTE